MNVIVPADEAATLLPRPLAISDGYPGLQADVLGHHPPTRRFVVHTANIDPTPCETCGGRGYVTVPHRGGGDLVGMHLHTSTCPTCDGSGIVPAAVTIAVKHDRRCLGCIDGFRPVGVATVTHCWPIHSQDDYSYDDVAAIEIRNDGTAWLYDDEWVTTARIEGADITGQVVGNPQPGDWMLQLADVQSSVDIYGASTAPPTTTPPDGGGTAVVGVLADTPTTNNRDGGER